MVKEILLLMLLLITSAVPIYFLITKCLTPRFSRQKSGVIGSLLFYVFAFIKNIIELYSDTTVLNITLFIVFEFIALRIVCADKTRVLVAFVTIMFVFYAIADLIFGIFYLAMGFDMDFSSSFYKSYITMAASSVFMIISFALFGILWNRFYKAEVSNKSIQLYIIFTLQALVITYIVAKALIGNETKMEASEVLIISAIPWIITDVFFIKIIQNTRKNAELQMSLNQALRMEKIQYQYYENLTDTINTIRKYRHDFNNTLSSLSLMLSNQQTFENGLDFYNEVKERYSDIELPYYCKNSTVNAVLFEKNMRAEDNGINFSISVELPDDIKISNLDLCSIYANLIDNAIEAAAKTKKREIHLKTWQDTGYLFIRCQNTFDNTLPKTKKSEEHGLGITIIKSISEKYSGKTYIDIDDLYTTLVVLKLQQ